MPDYSKTFVTTEQFNDEFGRKFTGPVAYLTDTDTILVVMYPPVRIKKSPWTKKRWPDGTMIKAYVYNVPITETILSHVVPIRYDGRTYEDGILTMKGDEMTRAEHLQWCKNRALEYVDIGKLSEAYASLGSDLGKHPETCGHPAIELGIMLMMSGKLSTPRQMRDFIEGCN